MKRYNIRFSYGLLVAFIIATLGSIPRLARMYFEDFQDIHIVYLNTFSFTLLIWVLVFRYFQFTSKNQASFVEKAVPYVKAIFMGILVMLPIAWLTQQLALAIGEINFKLPLVRGENDYQSPFFFFITLFKAIPITVLVILIKYVFDVLEEKNQIARENEKLKEISLRTELESLRQQINPHFLFNSLNSLKSLIDTNPERAQEFVVRLSQIYRYMLSSRKEDLIPLSQELELLNNYIFLLKARFLDNLCVKMDDFTTQQSRKVPPFALLLLVENCIKHNVISRELPLTIMIRVNETDMLEVYNNLQPKNSTEASHGIGLNNLWQRYSYFTDKQLIIHQDAQAFSVQIPLL